MQAKQTIGDLGVVRAMVGIIALAVTLAYGSSAAAAPGDGTQPAAATGCAATLASAGSAASGVEWSSSRGMPGKPY